MIWRTGAIVIAGIVALPLLGVASSLFTPQGELWQHLVESVVARDPDPSVSIAALEAAEAAQRAAAQAAALFEAKSEAKAAAEGAAAAEVPAEAEEAPAEK